MCKIMEEIGADRERQGKIQVAINLLKMEIASDEQISLATGFTDEEIQTLAALVKTTA